MTVTNSYNTEPRLRYFVLGINIGTYPVLAPTYPKITILTVMTAHSVYQLLFFWNWVCIDTYIYLTYHKLITVYSSDFYKLSMWYQHTHNSEYQMFIWTQGHQGTRNKIGGGTRKKRTCLFCKEKGHYRTCCPSNPESSTRPKIGKVCKTCKLPIM